MAFKEKSVAEVGEWLKNEKYSEQVVVAFASNEVDGEAFLALEDDDFKDLVKAIGPRRKLQEKRKQLCMDESAVATGDAVTSSVSVTQSAKVTPSTKEAESSITKAVAMRAEKKPGPPQLVKKTHNTIELQWSKPANGAKNIQSYTILFRDVEDKTGQWNTKVTQGAKASIVVDGLAPKAVYSFKVRAEYIDGCVEGETSEPIMTDAHLAMEMLGKSTPLPTPDGCHQTIHKLPLDKVMENRQQMIAKYSIGERVDPSAATEKVLMVMGATGAGKSTLINGIVNYIMGVEWKDTFRFKLIYDDPKEADQTKSVTRWITAYTLYKQEGSPLPYTLTIIDTPGFGDTEGLRRDKLITTQIKHFFSIEGPNGIDHVNGIGFVTQSSLARLTVTQQYIFDSILSIFGKDIAKSIFLMVTFADGQKPPVVTAAQTAGIPCSDQFYKFNNSALFADNSDDNGDNFDQMFWKMGCISFETFFRKFLTTASVSLCLTREVLSEREQLEAILEGLQPQINAGLLKIEVMRQEELVLQQREKEIATNKDFVYTISVPKIDKVVLPKGIYVTNCRRCNFTCHKSCAYSDDDDKYKCCAMGSDGKCQVCPDKCHWKEHCNTPYRFETHVEVETKTSKDLKHKYQTAIDGKDKAKGIMAGLRRELEDVHTNVCAMMDQAQKCLNRLDRIALKKNPLTRVDYLDLLITSEEQQAKPGWKERVAYYQAARDQALAMTKAKDLVVTKLKKFRRQASISWYERLKFW